MPLRVPFACSSYLSSAVGAVQRQRAANNTPATRHLSTRTAAAPGPSTAGPSSVPESSQQAYRRRLQGRQQQPQQQQQQQQQPVLTPTPQTGHVFAAVAAAGANDSRDDARGGRGDSRGRANGAGPAATDGADGDGDARPPRDFPRLSDGRQLVEVLPDMPAAAAAGALSQALGCERRAVVRFDGAAGGLKGLRALTLANVFMGSFRRALSFVPDVRQILHDLQPTNSLVDRPQAGDVSFAYRVMARSRALEPHEEKLPAAMRAARFVLDLSINVRQAWDTKGDVDEEQAYDLADTLYAALAAQQAEQDAAEAAEAEAAGNAAAAAAAQGESGKPRGGGVSGQNGGGGWEGESRGSALDQSELEPPPSVFVTTDLAQGLTMLTALALLQRRLREEGQEVIAEATLYRASEAAPRLDGRDGWVFAIRLGFDRPYLPPPPPERALTPRRLQPAAQRRGGPGGSARGDPSGGPVSDPGGAAAEKAAAAAPATASGTVKKAAAVRHRK